MLVTPGIYYCRPFLISYEHHGLPVCYSPFYLIPIVLHGYIAGGQHVFNHIIYVRRLIGQRLFHCLPQHIVVYGFRVRHAVHEYRRRLHPPACGKAAYYYVRIYIRPKAFFNSANVFGKRGSYCLFFFLLLLLRVPPAAKKARRPLFGFQQFKLAALPSEAQRQGYLLYSVHTLPSHAKLLRYI